MSRRTPRLVPLPREGLARFRALLRHKGALRHPIGMPTADDPASMRRVAGLRVGNTEYDADDPKTVQVGLMIDHIHRLGKETALCQSKPIDGVTFRVTGTRSAAGEWVWNVGAVGPSGEGLQVQVLC